MKLPLEVKIALDDLPTFLGVLSMRESGYGLHFSDYQQEQVLADLLVLYTRVGYAITALAQGEVH